MFDICSVQNAVIGAIILQSGVGMVGMMVDAETAEQLAFKDTDRVR